MGAAAAPALHRDAAPSPQGQLAEREHGLTIHTTVSLGISSTFEHPGRQPPPALREKLSTGQALPAVFELLGVMVQPGEIG